VAATRPWAAAAGRVRRRPARGDGIDRDDDPGLYFGTSTGQIFASVDAGDNWMQIADFLPSISSVEVATIE